MSTILVTGGAGFIGSHLCEKLLLLGYHVINLDNFCESYDSSIKRKNILNAIRHSNYRLVEGDIRDGSLLESLAAQSDIDIVVHLAALAGVRRSIESPLEYIDVDIKGTVNLLELCKKHSIGKFVFASSSSVYGINSCPFKEEDALELQTSPYAVAKQSGELYCRTYHHLYGIPIACLRFFTVYGPRQRPDMAVHIFTKAITEGREINIFGDGTNARDYTYVDDIIDGIMSTIQLRFDFEVFNLGNSSPTNISSLIEIIENNLGIKPIIKNIPMQTGDVPITCADISKAKHLLNYSPNVNLKAGIGRFVKWYCQNECRNDLVQ